MRFRHYFRRGCDGKIVRVWFFRRQALLAYRIACLLGEWNACDKDGAWERI